ncbi:hypothetical protein ACFE33_15600 (plasmid) [Falsihalocynthiibacter sp. SS001]|uniref:hypothetical protein n=1 Tax=Falsihalocynthiibacter sp. SS001 TaxID=3349698 RepID=UPI0036D3F4A8
MKYTIFLGTALGIAAAHSASAQSEDYMRQYCENASQQFYQDFESVTDSSYEGQRTDKTHAVNGTINLENSSETFQCSFNASGDTMVDFITQDQSWPDFVSGDGSPAQQANNTESEPPASDAAAEVMFEKGTTGTTLGGAIRGQEYFDYKLTASKGQMMSVNLEVTDSNGDGSVFFNILPPGSTGVAMYNSSNEGNTVEMRLTESGAYVIRLYLMGNDRDTDKTVGYNLDVDIR